jgi:RNA polymerase sigma-70 factor (ECF subfamily)
MDTELVVRAQNGDRAAFATLADAIYDRMHHVALRILRDHQIAEDAAQQAIVTIWRKLPQLRDPKSFEAWSYRLLVNACTSEARRNRHWKHEINTEPLIDPVAPDGVGVVHDRDQLERAFRRLSVDHRAVVILHIYLDMPLRAVAETLDIPIGTVKSRLTRAIRQMRLALEADAPAPLSAPQEVAR